MASTDTVGSVGNISTDQYFGNTQAKPKDGLDMQTFLQLLVTQLQNQNPLEPMDDASFYAQVAQLGQVQGLTNINNTLTLSQASSLMGKTVTATISADQSSTGMAGSVTGTVVKVSLVDGDYKIRVQDSTTGGQTDVKMSAITSVG